MVITKPLKQAICSLFDVHEDESGVHRVVTPLEYPGSNDQIVIRVRPSADGFRIDENGEAAFYAAMNGGDVDSDAVARWAQTLSEQSLVRYSNETISIVANDERLVAPYIFHVADAAQQLFAIATARGSRAENEFKAQLKATLIEVAREMEISVNSDVELPIAGGFKADHVLGDSKPIIIIAAASAARILEAELIYMRYREDGIPAYVWAVVQSQEAVGKKQFERAPYYTDKTVVYDSRNLAQLVAKEPSLNTAH